MTTLDENHPASHGPATFTMVVNPQHAKPCVLCAIGLRKKHNRKLSAELLLCIDQEDGQVYQMGKIE